jgi:hypothetical protein
MMLKNVHVQFDRLNVMMIHSSSGIFIGENRQWDWHTHLKTNAGFGVMAGTNNQSIHNRNIVMDEDFIDAPIISSSGNQGTANKKTTGISS